MMARAGVVLEDVMPRNISFAMTVPQFIDRSKDVTRRLGWDYLVPGELLWGVEKCMGLKLGEQVRRLGLIEIVSTRAEPLSAISADDVAREGFPGWSPEQFVELFCRGSNVDAETIVNRIEYSYIGRLLAEPAACPHTGLPLGDAGSLVFSSHELRDDWRECKEFMVGPHHLRQWLDMELSLWESERYRQVLGYYARAGLSC